MLTTTFRALHEGGACTERYRRLAKALGGIRRYGRETPITLLQILDICGLDDALWSLCCTEPRKETDRLARLFACRCVRETPLGDGRTVWDLLTDERLRHAIEVAERYAIGEATADELDAARNAIDALYYSRSAVGAAIAAASYCAPAAAMGASRNAAWDADAAMTATATQERILREMLEAS